MQLPENISSDSNGPSFYLQSAQEGMFVYAFERSESISLPFFSFSYDVTDKSLHIDDISNGWSKKNNPRKAFRQTLEVALRDLEVATIFVNKFSDSRIILELEDARGVQKLSSVKGFEQSFLLTTLRELGFHIFHTNVPSTDFTEEKFLAAFRSH